MDVSNAKLRQRVVAALAPRVSVILPSYNHASFVEQAVESVLSQSFGDLELVVTDDGSTDGTADRIRSFCDPRINFEALSTNRGYSFSLNTSIARARGELIALHCSDDVFLPDKLERQVAFLDANPGVAAVFGKPIFVDKEGRPCLPHSHPFDGIFLNDLPDRFAWLRFFFLRGNGLCHPTALVRRAVFDEAGEYDPLLVQLQDYDFWVRVSGRHEIRVLDEPLVAYRVLGEGLNTSWPSAEVVRRATWETRRVLRRFLAFDAALIKRTFEADLAELGVAPDLSPRVSLGLLLAARGKDSARQTFALELLEEAVAHGDAGVDHFMFSSLAGELDPFNLHLAEAKRQAVKRCRAAEPHAAAADARSDELERRMTEAEDRATAAEARKDELERCAVAAEALAHAVTSSTIWRSTTLLRRLVTRQPALRLAMRRALSLVAPNLVSAVLPRDQNAQTGQANEGTEGCRIRAVEKRSSEPVDHRSDPFLAVHALTHLAPSPVPPEAGLAAAGQPLPEWEHVPEGWRPDDPRAAGWEHASVIAAQQRKWPAFVRAIQSTNPLGIYHEAAQIDSENPAAHNFVLTFAYVLARAAAGRGSLSVLDWGGGLGHYAVIARATLPEVCIEYTVVDLPDICAAGRKVLPDVRFTSNPEESLSCRYDLIFASGSLQYAADWRGLFRRFASSASGWVFLSRTPFVNASPAFVVVQRPHSAGGYRTEYLSHVFNRPELLAEAMAAGLVLEREFLMVGERVAAVGAPEPFEYRGFLLRPIGRSL